VTGSFREAGVRGGRSPRMPPLPICNLIREVESVKSRAYGSRSHVGEGRSGFDRPRCLCVAEDDAPILRREPGVRASRGARSAARVERWEFASVVDESRASCVFRNTALNWLYSAANVGGPGLTCAYDNPGGDARSDGR